MSTDEQEPRSVDPGTQAIQPIAFRYPNGWLSWQAVIGDMALRGNPDARLRLEAVGVESGIVWTAEVEWGPNQERAADYPSLADTLSNLWREVTAHHWLYDGDMTKRGPALYGPDEWLDSDTSDGLHRLLSVTRAVFGKDWALMLTYHPVAQPEQRVHGRLIARRGEVAVAGSGPTLLASIRALIRAGTPFFAQKE